VRYRSELIGLLPGDTEFARDIFGAEAHVDVSVGIIGRTARIERFCCRHGHWNLDSVPPATMTSAEPERMRSRRERWLQAGGTKAVDGHRAGFDGSPARSGGDCGATFMPCSPSGMAQPRITIVNFLGVDAKPPALLDRERGGSIGARARR